MELSDVTQVIDLTSDRIANEYFALGWKLLNQYTVAYHTEGPLVMHLTPHYILAWYGPDPKHPEHRGPQALQESGPSGW